MRDFGGASNTERSATSVTTEQTSGVAQVGEKQIGFMKLRIEPLTPKLWSAFEDLFGKKGACNGCWCMNWRIGREYCRRPPEANKADFKAIVRRGPAPGLVAFDGDLAVGWCQLTPRSALPWLNHQWRLKRVDDLPVWSISCFYTRKEYRRQGITSALIKSALKAAKDAGAPAIEAYPVDARLTGTSSWTGFATTFERLGFQTVARHTPPRPIMRRMLR